ncbi:MAG: DUF1460 domain-containing protein [Legionellaceae bacterium]|nr:DUF1460 domain-containing protein [Legionellaceae bacterium]
MLQCFLLLSLYLSLPCGWAEPVHTEAGHLQSVKQLYHGLAENPKTKLIQRLDYFSAALLGKPYILYALGEGTSARFDQNPRFRMDGFDCETFVTTVIALSLSKSPHHFPSTMNRLRYRNDSLTFLNRHHFTDRDWNYYNQRAGILKDITRQIHDEQQQSLAKTAKTTIDKAAWIEKTAAQRVHLKQASPTEVQKEVEHLRQAAAHIKPVEAEIPYLPLSALFDDHQQPIPTIWQQIPDGAIIEIVRPDWPLRKRIGTNLNVSHLGFVFWHQNKLWFRHASSESNKVQDELLEDYLRAALKSPTIKGINIQVMTREALD